MSPNHAPKIALIGAGSVVFTRTLCNDLLLTPTVAGSTVVLMDVDPGRLREAHDLVQSMVERCGSTIRVKATTDQREAVADADYVITTFQVGGLDAHALDIEIPQRYGVEQCIGDTIGPGGVFRGLRTIPLLLGLCRDLDDVAPDALLLNYVNPMAAACWAMDRASGRPVVGLCESVPRTARMLARWVEVPYEEMSYVCAGINHQAWFLELRRYGEDLYPRLREAARHEERRGEEPVRVDLLEHFGYFVTESSAHASEYLPYFRKSAAMVDDELVPRFAPTEENEWFGRGRTGGDLHDALAAVPRVREDYRALRAGERELPSARSDQYASFIIEAVESNELTMIYGNVPNRSLVGGLPEGCCVEVPCGSTPAVSNPIGSAIYHPS